MPRFKNLGDLLPPGQDSAKGASAAIGKELDPSLITTVKRGDLAIEVLETGKVQPREKVEIKSKVAGQVLKVFVELY